MVVSCDASNAGNGTLTLLHLLVLGGPWALQKPCGRQRCRGQRAWMEGRGRTPSDRASRIVCTTCARDCAGSG